jgi:Tol biopolymer transport system component
MSGVLVVAGDNASAAQLWLINYADGRARRITNDLNAYRTIALTQDGKKLATVQSLGAVNLWLVPDGNTAKAVKLPTGNVSSFFTSTGGNVTWMPDGRIVYVSNESGKADIWVADADGNNRKQLTANGAFNVSPVVTADGRYIIFVSWQDGKRNVWRMNTDGSNLMRLTSGLADAFPAITPDSRWVLFGSLEGTKPTLWKVGIDGGTPVQVTDHVVTLAAVSPDGRWIAFSYPESPDPFAPPNRLAIMPFEGGPNIKTFEITVSGTALSVVHWARDGKSILYTVTANNLSNIWSQPIDGGAPKQVTNFTDLLMTGFSWSHDGKQLACTRGTLIRDAILITDQK